MSLSRKRSKQLRKLRRNTEELWSEQQHVIARASVIAREAKRQASILAKDHVGSRIQGHYEHYVLPGAVAAGKVARVAGDVVERTVVPVVGAALGTALSVADVAKDKRGRATVQRVARKKKCPGSKAGAYVVAGVAIATITGLAYAVWQTFRTDDDLWVSDDEEADQEQG